MFFTGFQHAADLFDEDSFFLFRDGIFPFLWCLVRVQILQLLRCDEEDLIGKVCPQITVQSVNVVVEIFQRVVQCRNCFLQVFFCSVFLRDDFFPVPLIHIDGMEIVQFFIAPDRVHIRVKSGARLEVVLAESHPLPLGKRLHDLNFLFTHILDCKTYCTFYTVEVIVQSCLRSHEQRCGNASQLQSVCQFLLKKIFYFLDCPLTFHIIDHGRVVLRNL